MELSPFDNCCGAEEIGGLSRHVTPETAMRWFASRRSGRRGYMGGEPPIYIFSGAEKRIEGADKIGYASAFAKFIRANGLGHVVGSRRVYNPVHRNNEIRVFVWTPDWKALAAWKAEAK